MKKYKWRTHKVIQETKDAITLMFATGPSVIHYQAGQFLNISCVINGEQVSRSYSFSSVPSAPYPAITVKRAPGGKMSNYLVDNARYVSEWDIEAPFGNFILNQSAAKDTEKVFLAGGSGISPLFAMLKSLGDSGPTPLLLYAGKTPDDLIFSRELEDIQDGKRLHVFYSFSAGTTEIRAGNSVSGRFSQPIIHTAIHRYIKERETAHYYICGPSELMHLYKDALLAIGIPEQQIHMEHFDPLVPDNIPLEAGDEQKEVLVSYYESCYEHDEPQTYECTTLIAVRTGQTILDAAMEQDIKVAQSCRKGTCGSCRATKRDGNVRMLHNYALTEEEVAEGGILLCQSYPLDQSVAIVIG